MSERATTRLFQQVAPRSKGLSMTIFATVLLILTNLQIPPPMKWLHGFEGSSEWRKLAIVGLWIPR
uniref:Uncharacterized protein n=1 Tax=Picea sitchensis TaxID=3332 RepID=A9NMV9_PICSI|nr:unknown [Picea sitchensis]